MTHTYNISGMTCSGCEAKVKNSFFLLPDIKAVEVSKETGTATVTMDRHISLVDLQKALGGEQSKYRISANQHIEVHEPSRSWFETYKPILIIFFYISLVTVLIQLRNPTFNLMEWMQHFMAGFFLAFSFFKLLNLKGFAESYVMYDVLARRIPAWAYLYAFIELGLGIAYVTGAYPWITNLITVIVMGISIIGVLQSVLNNKKIQCACLGAVFNLPMSTVTIIEDALMIMMSTGMLILMA